jgi:tetratricopeptide (TPR) repeat protein
MQSTSDQNKIKEMIGLVEKYDSLSAAQREEIIKKFEEYECWEPYFKIVNKNLEQLPNESFKNYTRLARVYYSYLEDPPTTAQVCSRAVGALKMGYKKFKEEFLPQVLFTDDWSTEALIFETIYEKFQETQDKVQCLERLSLLYEKKTHNEIKLQANYEKLLKVDPQNIKALRYFKLAYTQSGDWDEVIAILTILIRNSQHTQEIFRYGQELAAILLYQKDKPQDAIQALEKHCSDSPLDTSTIHFDAYQRLGDSQGCIRVLRQCLLNIDDTWGKAVIHYKIGEIEDQTNNPEKAVDEYSKSLKLSPSFLEPIEKIINIYLSKNDWKNTTLWIKELESKTKDPVLKQRINEAAQRLQSAISASA